MKLYLAVSSRRGAIPLRVDAIAPAVAKVVFPAQAGPWHRREWSSPDGLTRLFGWSNEPEEEDDRFLPLLQTDGRAAVGVPGYVGPTDRVRRTLDAERLHEVDEWSGVYGLFRADRHGFDALTTACRIHPVFHGRMRGHIVAGNRALLVHGVLRALQAGEGAPPRFDPLALEPLVREGYFLGGDTPYEGVQALPAHSTLRAEKGKAVVTTRPLPQVDVATSWPGAGREQQEALVAALLAAAAPLGDFTEAIGTTLTGGRDSRLVAAVLRASGVSFSTMTNGFPDHPDVVLAARVAALLGVPHRVGEPKRDPSGEALLVPHPLMRTRTLLRSTEGMISALYNVGPVRRFTPAPRLHGAGGEQLRGGFLSKVRFEDGEAARALVRKVLAGGSELLTEPARARAGERLAAWVDRDPLEALDLLYLYDRSGRWAASSRAVSRHAHATFDLLFDNRVTRGALAIPPAVRWSERPIFDLIARLAPALRDVPLIGRRWHFDSGRGWFASAAWRARAPVPRPDARAGGFDWRNPLSPTIRAIFRDQILGGSSALFELVDRAKVESRLDQSSRGRVPTQQLWHLYTASVLLTGDWLNGQPALDPISIPLPERLRRATG